MSSQRKKKACNYLQRELLVWENAGIQFINKAQRNRADVIENSRESFSAFSSFLWWKVLRLHHCHYSGTSSHSLPTRTYAVDVVPKWPHVSSPVSPEAAAAATAAATRSWCAKKKIQPHRLRLWEGNVGLAALITPSHDSTHQGSSSNKSISL